MKHLTFKTLECFFFLKNCVLRTNLFYNNNNNNNNPGISPSLIVAMLIIAKLQGNVLDMLIGLLRNMHTYAGFGCCHGTTMPDWRIRERLGKFLPVGKYSSQVGFEPGTLPPPWQCTMLAIH